MHLGANDKPTAGDRLDEIFAQIEPLQEELDRLVSEMNAIEKTPTGRWRKRLKPEQVRRLDALVEEQGRVLAKLRPLTQQACAVVAQATTT